MFYIGPYPVYVFDSSIELADKTLDAVKKLEFISAPSAPESNKPLRVGMVNDNGERKAYHESELYKWFYECLSEVESKHLKNLKLKIVDMWAVQCKFGEMGYLHKHVNSMWSGVYHLTDCKRSELTLYHDDQFYKDWAFLLDDNLQKTNIVHHIIPKKGRLHIWPSTVPHMVKPHTETNPRYSLAFNTFFEIEEKYETKKINLKFNNLP